ncbi:SRPBCC domain-containing protein [Mucilaginibacter calamicampi]|uniref:SRPBCC domain-containing protein n=1 Tax=Mucilaginibacter calamicampi TaxID=1302352 RepID=A0ABW2YUE5_9SPHI
MAKLSLKTSIDINAPAAEVWEALTNPAIIKQYFFGTDLNTDWKEGSPIVWTGEWQGKTYQDKGKVLQVDPGKYVKYSYWSSMSGTEDKPENYQNVSYTLTENNGVTRFELEQDNIKDEAAKQHSEQNWQTVFEKMKELVEGK